MNGKEKKYFFSVLRGIALSLLITIPVGYVVFLTAMILFYDDPEKEPSVLLPKIIVIAVCFAAMYFVHIKQAAEFSKVKVADEKYNFKADLREHINTEGKCQLAVYAVLAIIFEVFALVGGEWTEMIALFVGICIPTVWIVTIPVVRCVVGYVLMVVILFGITLFSRYLAHERARKKVVVFGEIKREKEINYNPMSVADRMKKKGFGKSNHN